MRNVRFLILTCITLLSWHCYAQRYEVGIAGMGTGYMGDINPQNTLYVKVSILSLKMQVVDTQTCPPSTD
ncbi:hypothetical protein [Sphingobacterium sp. T2]|uniref:hypothetical protein n=1 Tax=Sphingobacterium sp. T2 TaxID=1590596 RepID=UPI0012E09A47|nr:hypothetical protein [Sphingobacterium sp. T2]